jgi:hypothetical protein
MAIKKISGTGDEFFLTIAPIAMSKAGAKYFGMYPVTTGDDRFWYVSTTGKKILGFVAVEENIESLAIKDFYLAPESNRENVFNEIMSEILNFFERSECEYITGYTKTEFLDLWKNKKFEVSKEGKNWSTLKKEKK